MEAWFEGLKRPWSLPNLSKSVRANGNRVVQTPERYLELATKCMERVHTMTSLQLNHGLCQYLAIKLLSTVQIAQNHTRSHSPEVIEESRPGSFKLLFRLAKEVESFIHACCNDQWIQHAIMFTNVSEYVTSLGYDLNFCREILRNAKAESAFSGKEAESKIVRLRAIRDQSRLLEKVKAFIRSSNASTPECQLATYLLARLIAASTMCIPGFLRTSLSSSSLWEVDYECLERLESLGAGAAGIVHKTVWLGELVAEKTFSGSDHSSFRNEVLILAGLSHPNIVPLFCYAMDHRQCSILMELMEGDLYNLMQTRLRRDRTLDSPFSIPEAVDIMLQIAKGVNYLHENKVVHRDLKSYNILVKSAKEVDIEYVNVKVADFGLSKTKETSSSFSNQSFNTGSTRWMAPELMHPQAAYNKASMPTSSEVKKYPFKSDVYSFAMVCYEVLTGELPFQTTSSLSDVRSMVLDGQRPKLPNQCPLLLKTLIQKCWDSDANARPSFSVIHAELRYLKCLSMTDALEENRTNSLGSSLCEPYFSYQLDHIWKGKYLNLQHDILAEKEDFDSMYHRHQHNMQQSLSLPATQLERTFSFPAEVSLPMDAAFLLSILTLQGPSQIFEMEQSKVESKVLNGHNNHLSRFLAAVGQLQQNVEFFTQNCSLNATNGALYHAHNLLNKGMNRLADEFKALLIQSKPVDSARLQEMIPCPGRDNGNVKVGPPELPVLYSPRVIPQLREMAQRLVPAGYQEQCLQIYRDVRASTLEQCLRKLGVEKLSKEDVQKMQWEALEVKIGSWIQYMRISVKLLFTAERKLCDQIWYHLDPHREKCFADVSDSSVHMLLSFGEAFASIKKSPEKLFVLLDMYEAMHDLLPEIEIVFSSMSATGIRQAAQDFIKRLAQIAKNTFEDFEDAVSTDATKTRVLDGTVHMLTSYVINYVKFLFDYQKTLNHLLGGGLPQRIDTPSPLAAATIRILSVLRTNLDGKAKLYRDPALAHLFLLNNIHYMVESVRRNSELNDVMGYDWVQCQRRVVQQRGICYQRTAWNKTLSYVTASGSSSGQLIGGSSDGSGISKSAIKERLENFSSLLEELHMRQTQWTIPDTELREAVRLQVAEIMLPAYRSFIKRYSHYIESDRSKGKYIRYTPEDFERMIGELFEGKMPVDQAGR